MKCEFTNAFINGYREKEGVQSIQVNDALGSCKLRSDKVDLSKLPFGQVCNLSVDVFPTTINGLVSLNVLNVEVKKS